jgi:hypothetical protein
MELTNALREYVKRTESQLVLPTSSTMNHILHSFCLVATYLTSINVMSACSDLSHKLLQLVNKRGGGGGGEGEAKKLFDEMDIDGNGVMSTKEFSEALAKINLHVSKRAVLMFFLAPFIHLCSSSLLDGM